MLLNLGHAEQKDLKGSLGGLIGGVIAVAFLGMLTHFFIGDSELGAPSLKVDGYLQASVEEQGVIAVIARPLFTEYMIVLEVTGILLLAAIVGTIFLTQKRPI